MHIRIVFLLAVMVSMPASAQQVFKCVKGKQVSYQTDPCPPGETVKAWDAKPEAYDPYRAAQVQQAEQELAARNAPQQVYRSGAAPVGTRVSIHADEARCEAAKRDRERVFKAAGLKRTFELTRKMDDRVYSACK